MTDFEERNKRMHEAMDILSTHKIEQQIFYDKRYGTITMIAHVVQHGLQPRVEFVAQPIANAEPMICWTIEMALARLIAPVCFPTELPVKDDRY